jgi:outer membrane protein assembly factor BamB
VHLRRHLELRPEMTIVRGWLEEAESLDLLRGVMGRALRPAPGPGTLAVEQLPEIKPRKAAETDEKEKKDAAAAKPAADAGGELTVVAFRGIRGRIVGAKGDAWEIDVGSADGVVAGTTFAVTRDGAWVGDLRAVTVGEHATTCAPAAGKRSGTEAGAAWSFRGGDTVAQREDVLGEGVADEALRRKRVLGWQQEEQGLLQEYKDIQNRQRRALREYSQKPSIAGIALFAGTRAKLHAEYRAWLARYGAWEEGVVKALEEGTENRHYAAYRDQIRRQRQLQDKDAGWEEILLDVRTDMAAFYADRGAVLERQREALEKKSKELATEKKALDERIREALTKRRGGNEGLNGDIQGYNRRIEGLNKDAEAYDKAAAKLQAELGAFAVELWDIDRARERWQAGDDVQTLLLGRRKTLQLESLVNSGRYELLRARNAKALRKFRFALALEPGAELETAARDGAELAALRLVLRGEAVNEAGGPLTPPLREIWSVPIPGRPVGAMGADGARVFAFYALAGADGAETGKLVAREHGSGAPAWELAFPGLPLGNWVLAGGDLVFATTAGALYRVDAAAGEVRSRLDLSVLGEGALERSVLRAVERGVWWLVTVRGGQERVYGIDFEGAAASGVFLPEGSVYDAAVSGRDLLFSGRRRREKDLESYIGRIPWKSLGGGGGVPLTAVKDGQVEWLGMVAGALVVNVVSEGEARRSHLLLADPADPLRASRLTVEGSGAVAGSAEAGGRIYVLLRDGALKAVDTASKSLLWSAELPLPDDEEEVRGGAILHAGEDGVVALVGGAEPPWNVFALDPEGLALASERVSRGAAAPAYAEGRVFATEYDGSLFTVGLTGGADWNPSRERAESLMLPGPPPAVSPSNHEALLAASPSGEERVRFWRGASHEGPERSEPLLLETARLFVRSPLDSRLRAFSGGARP